MRRMSSNRGKDIEKEIEKFLTNFSDIQLDYSYKNRGPCYPDFVIRYGGNIIAVIEVKVREAQKDVKTQIKENFNSYRNIFSSICFYIANINNEYWYYDDNKDDFVNKDIFILLDEIITAIYEYADNGDSFISDFCSKVNSLKTSPKYKTILKKHLTSGNLLTYGDRIFFREESEVCFMKELLNSEKNTYTELCKYTTANAFYQTIKTGKFRLNDIAVMNDALETKVVEKYSYLKSEVSTMSSYIHQGFILCFSRDSTDKLMNWEMYGDKGKGVCYIIKNVTEVDKFYFAPIVYVKKGTKHPILSFLNDLSGLTIGNSCHFHLRLWHIWKFFFKYNYYEGENEERLLYVTKKHENPEIKEEWSEKYGITHYVEKEIVPFKIKKAILGPLCVNSQDTKKLFEKIINNSYPIKSSVIIGYKG